MQHSVHFHISPRWQQPHLQNVRFHANFILCHVVFEIFCKSWVLLVRAWSLCILFTSAQELYIAYNNISDLSQLSLLDHLEVLDLEGNNIEDINQMQYLGLCCKLRSLTVEGNLICLKPNAESAEVRTRFVHITLIFCWGSASVKKKKTRTIFKLLLFII